MKVTADMVREVRENTGYGMMDCKRAILKADGDLDKACELLLNRPFPRYAMVTFKPKEKKRDE